MHFTLLKIFLAYCTFIWPKVGPTTFHHLSPSLLQRNRWTYGQSLLRSDTWCLFVFLRLGAQVSSASEHRWKFYSSIGYRSQLSLSHRSTKKMHVGTALTRYWDRDAHLESNRQRTKSDRAGLSITPRRQFEDPPCALAGLPLTTHPSLKPLRPLRWLRVLASQRAALHLSITNRFFSPLVLLKKISHADEQLATGYRVRDGILETFWAAHRTHKWDPI